MNRIVVKTKVSGDGILHLTLPLGLAQADTEVLITVEAVVDVSPMPHDEWSAWVDSMDGSWEGSFERPPQGLERCPPASIGFFVR